MRKPKFDPTINLGHIGQISIMMVGIVALYYKMDNRMSLAEHDIILHGRQIDKLTTIQESQDRTLTILTATKNKVN